MLLIYTKASSPRLTYTFDFIFREIIGIDYKLTHNQNEFALSQLPKFSYGEAPVRNEIFIFSSGLLFEKGLREQDISVFDWENSKAFFATHHKYEFPFDPFAASFYLVSRYEEYLPHLRDSHDRFDTTESLAYQKNFLGKPLVNIYAYMIRDLLVSRYPYLKFPERKYRYISTIDIDNAWAFLQKGFMRTAGAYARSLVKLDIDDLTERTKVLTRLSKDPYDTYDY